jgi:hypothetical protein
MQPLLPAFVFLQPLEVLRPGMVREFIVAEEEDEYGEIILSLAAIEVRAVADDAAAPAQQQQFRRRAGAGCCAAGLLGRAAMPTLGSAVAGFWLLLGAQAALGGSDAGVC